MKEGRGEGEKVNGEREGSRGRVKKRNSDWWRMEL